jgi:predicted NUDIX family NTP pyrophosphohydrolase
MPRLLSVVFTLLFLMTTAIPSSAQRRYFEYNNPDAKKLNDKRRAILCGRMWYVDSVAVIIRGDTTYYYHHGLSIDYNEGGTYWLNRELGNWSIRYGRYLRHEPVEAKAGVSFAGIFSVTSISDTSLVLTKLQTSSRDMQRVFFLSHKLRQRQSRSYARGTVVPPVRIRKVLSSEELDSISYLSEEGLFTAGFPERDGKARVVTADSVYEVPRRYGNPDAYRRVFAKEEVEDALPDHYGRFTPDLPEVLKAEEAVAAFWKGVLEESGIDYGDPLENQFRQFVGYVDQGGERKLLMFWFCQYHRYWKKRLIHSSDAPYCHFKISFNQRTGKCEDFRLNGRD